MDLQWSFDSNTNFDDWIVTSDQDHNEGFSHCQMSLSPTGKGLFSGVLSTETVKDGKVKYAGYCNFHSIPPTRSFKRETYHDWTPYTHLVKLKISFFFPSNRLSNSCYIQVLRIRGDGRSYMVNIGSQGYFDLQWNDMFNCPLYTRGGPHWQISRVSS